MNKSISFNRIIPFLIAFCMVFTTMFAVCTTDTYAAVKKPARVSGLKGKSTEHTVTLSWAKSKNATGYEVHYYPSVVGGKKDAKTIKKIKTNSVTVKNLNSCTLYYFCARAYKEYKQKYYYNSKTHKWQKKKPKKKYWKGKKTKTVKKTLYSDKNVGDWKSIYVETKLETFPADDCPSVETVRKQTLKLLNDYFAELGRYNPDIVIENEHLDAFAQKNAEYMAKNKTTKVKYTSDEYIANTYKYTEIYVDAGRKVIDESIVDLYNGENILAHNAAADTDFIGIGYSGGYLCIIFAETKDGYWDVNQPSKGAYAVFDSSDGSLKFYTSPECHYINGYVVGTKTYYTGVEQLQANRKSDVPWESKRSSVKSVSFENVVSPISTAYWFYGLDNDAITSIDLTNLDTSKATSMHGMFGFCKNLTSLDLSNLDTTNVTDMGYMFQKCELLTSLDLSTFDTSNVTNMSYMFSNCKSLETIYVSDTWNVDKVTEPAFMFENCKNLVGEQGTTYNKKYTNEQYAKVDGGISDPGYLTHK